MTLPNEKLTFDCFQIFQLQCCLQLLFVGWTCHSVSVVFGRQLCGVGSLLPPSVGPGDWSWVFRFTWRAPLPTIPFLLTMFSGPEVSRKAISLLAVIWVLQSGHKKVYGLFILPNYFIRLHGNILRSIFFWGLLLLGYTDGQPRLRYLGLVLIIGKWNISWVCTWTGKINHKGYTYNKSWPSDSICPFSLGKWIIVGIKNIFLRWLITLKNHNQCSLLKT